VQGNNKIIDSKEETDRLAKRIEDILEREVPEKKVMFVRAGTTPSIGRAVSAAGESGENIVMAGLKLVPKQQRERSVFEVGQLIRRKINEIPGVIKVGLSLGNPIGRMITGMGGKAIQVEIIGHSFEDTTALAEKIKKIMQEIEGAVDISISRDINLPELRIKIDREKLSVLGLDMYTVSSTLKTFIEGSVASRYREKAQTYDIYVRLEENSRQKIEDIQNLIFVSPLTRKTIRLSSFAQITETSGPQEIERVNRERVVRVECNVFGRPVGKVKEELQRKLNSLVIPQDIRINFGGEAEEQVKAFRELGILLLLSIVLVYMVMAGQFESLRDPFIVMFSVPFAFTGVFLGFILTGTTLNIVSFLGIIMLTGIVVNNAIVLISYIGLLRKRGTTLLEAVKLAGKTRLRAVLMTTITTLAGLFPMAVLKGEGSEVWQPLGVAIISGLSLSTFITLLFIPTLYALLEKKKK
ncbi:MAG: efflux RND transporter permease subunit, partial [Candidatus Omnitrophica bacterium]|nr:efflux RND transporter permease subunit [Candidatus Omnitrophota bacterium]